jgi:pimeloyl-ACP methyl ester carboxylesterase
MAGVRRHSRRDNNMKTTAKRNLVLAVLLGAVLLVVGCQVIQRKVLFYPSHDTQENGFSRWENDGRVVGYARLVKNPEHVWLMLHGNGGQASGRTYALPAFSERDSLYILEYPGFGARDGWPSRHTFDAAAREGYDALRSAFPGMRIGVVGESLGSGPAATLSRATPAPDKMVFIVPFDTLKSVGGDRYPHILVNIVLAGSWNNIEAMKGFKGPVDIFGAEHDEVIAVAHAQAFAASIPQAKFQLIPGGHGWANGTDVSVRFP